MSKSAMQELIEKLKKSKKLLEDSIQKNGGLDNEKNKNTHYYSLGIGECIIEANQLLEKEKEQIIEAYGTAICMFYESEQPEEYYNQTFNQNK
jgi:hypothetical protein